MGRLFGLALVGAMSLCAVQAQAARLALVVGNADYTELSDLGKTLNDSQGYREALGDLGFTVFYYTDLDRGGFDRAISQFLDQTRPGDETVFVYAGHGWSDGQTNYLLPTDTPARGSATMISRWSVPLKNGATGVLDEIAGRGARLQVSVIDACRNNPFKAAGNTRASGRSRGLTLVSPPRGAFVIYSAGTGEEALDDLPTDGPQDRYSVFTRTFLPLLKSGVPLERAISEAQVKTSALASQIGHEQSPAYYDETLGDTCLKAGGCKAIPVGVDLVPPVEKPVVSKSSTSTLNIASGSYDPAKAAYDDAKRRGTKQALETVSKFFPNSYWGAVAAQDAAALEAGVPAARTAPAIPVGVDFSGPEEPTRCDKLAGAPGDPDNPVSPDLYIGVPIHKIKDARAAAACEHDAARFPESRRQLTALGRAQIAQRDYSAAYTTLKKAEGMGSLAARAELGWLYRTGKGVPQNIDKAIEHFEAAIADDIPAAVHGLGLLYRDGIGVPRNGVKAIDLMERAGDVGYGPAVTDLGVTFKDGISVPADYRLASKWLNFGMSLREPRAMRNYGLMYAYGQGEKVNGKTAMSWLKMAYEDGDGDSALYIGDLYRDGIGVDVDNRAARNWYRKARAHGNAEAAERISRLPR